MKTEIAKLWAKALRSGKYTQGYNRLKKGDEFCCLGVLCDLHSKENKKTWASEDDGESSYLGRRNILPIGVQGWAGVRTPNGLYKEEETLVKKNDKLKLTFDQIAGIIEKNVKNL